MFSLKFEVLFWNTHIIKIPPCLWQCDIVAIETVLLYPAWDVSLLGAGRLLRIVMCGPGPRGETRGPEWGVRSEERGRAATQINVHKLSHHLLSSTHLYRMGTIMLGRSFDPYPKVYFSRLYALLALALYYRVFSQEGSVESFRAKLFSEFEEVSWKRSNTKHQKVFDL